MRRSLALAIISASLAVMLSSGIRQSFGLFQIPMTTSLGIGREAFSFAAALNSLVYGLPIAGLLANRIGPRWVVAGGGVLYVVGMFWLTQVQTIGALTISFGIVVGLALSATTYVVVLGAVGQMVKPEERSRWFGIITAVGSTSMFAIPPIARWLVANFGWRGTMMALGIVSGLLVILAFGLPNSADSRAGAAMSDEPDHSFIEILKKAQKNKSYWLLFLGFFVCGYHVSFIGIHLPAFLEDSGLGADLGAIAISVTGAFNVLGASLFGYLGDMYRKKYLLSGIYLGRAIVILIFILLPITTTSALVFSAAMGFLWLATVPLTSGSVAQIFGTRYLATLYGIVFFGHQIGSFIGVWLGGRVFDTMGTYMPIWWSAIALGVLAFFVHLPITDQPVAKAQPA